MADAPLEDRPRSRRQTSQPGPCLPQTLSLGRGGASIALVLTASVTLSVGQVRLLIDEGFANGLLELLVLPTGVSGSWRWPALWALSGCVSTSYPVYWAFLRSLAAA